MSDIPVGSPPAPPGRHAAPGGWYPDPLDLTQERYWDGWQWSRTTRASEGPVRQPVAPGTAAPGPHPAYGGGPVQPYAPVASAARQATHTADGVALAGWWWRALAGLVDALVVGTVTALLTLPFYRGLIDAVGAYWDAAYRAAQTGAPPPPQPNLAATLAGTDQLFVVGITLVVGLAFHVPFLRLRGATPGLLLCGMRVVPLDAGHAAGLRWSSVLVRAGLWVVPWALSLWILTVADVLVPLWHPKRQTLHDLAAQTQVVRLR